MPGGGVSDVCPRAGHTLIGHRLFLPAAWAADEERRELTGVPNEVMFATKLQLAAKILVHARAGGVIRAWVAANEVYGGRESRMSIRLLGYGYVIAVKSDHRVRTPAGTSTVTDLVKRVPTRSWQRLRPEAAARANATTTER